MIVQNYGLGYSGSSPTEAQLLVRRKEDPQNGTVPLILGLHGHGGAAQQFAAWNVPNAGGPVYHVYKLVQSGYMVLGLDAGGATAWSDQVAMDRINDALNWAATLGLKTDKVGVMGWSMGGFTALNWIKRNPSRVSCAWLWCPATDLPFFHDAAYTPPYSPSGIAIGGYTAEIDAAYGSSATYAANSTGFRISDEYSSWRNLNIPMKVAHAPDDATIPIGQSQTFVSQVNDDNVRFRFVPSGGHTLLFPNVPAIEVVKHFKASLG